MFTTASSVPTKAHGLVSNLNIKLMEVNATGSSTFFLYQNTARCLDNEKYYSLNMKCSLLGSSIECLIPAGNIILKRSRNFDT